jgi:hypothetical protein
MRGVDPRDLAIAQARGRMAFGAAFLAAPGLAARAWVGDDARRPGAKVLCRALGARDLALGAAGLLAERDGDRRWAARAFAAQGFADAVDFAALAATPRLPLASRLFGIAMAGGSAAVAAAYAARLARGQAEPSSTA